MEVFKVAILTLVIYSLISTILFIITKEDEDVLCVFGLGICGWILWAVLRVIRKIIKYFKYSMGKRTIVQDVNTNKLYKTKSKDFIAILESNQYKIVKRYATKSEWKDLPSIVIKGE